MALQDQLIKINLDNLDTKGIYLKDKNSTFKAKEINKNDLKKIDYENIDIVLKFYFRNKQIKKTINFYNITGLHAVKNAVAKRNLLKDELLETGVIKKKDFKTLNDIFKVYMDLKSRTLSKENIYSTAKTYDKWIRENIGHINIDKITVADIQMIVNDMLRQGLAPRTAQSIKQILRPVFNYAIEELDILMKNAALKVAIPKVQNIMNFELSDEQRKRLFYEIWNYEDLRYRGIMLFLFVGRRLNEALTLEWTEINLNDNLNTYIITAEKSKNRKRHEYPLSAPLVAFLKEYGIKKRGFLFEGVKTPHVTDDTFRSHWIKVYKRAGVEKMRIHDTRHILGNTLINKGVTEDIIAKVLGHQSYSITSRYAKVSLDSINEALKIYFEDISDIWETRG
ncbi:site-specific integrase [Sulfurimonas crateris]|uniref:Site-specific integrase n=1 Tax=Sulfurimonas crateris TaxID=2574727 RepID=A0A4U2ZCX5_9BACT|nr:site-specific integrase [Sulfurimonas crateris]TKI71061.1 site-specific integrase [Sulfurimonas crateris]